MKAGPLIAMLLIVGLSVWIMLHTTKRVPPTPGAAVFEMVISSHKVKVEQVRQEDGTFRYRFIGGPLADDRVLTGPEFEARLQQETNLVGRPWLYRLFNVSTGSQFLWVAVGLGGQLVFSSRMLVQWLTSEKKRRSVVPAAFWYLSLIGAVALTAYFIWRQDMVGLLGQSMGLVIYVRNIRLLRLQNRHTPDQPANAQPA
jgi:lipid-A-disaccharide synthase-like uncharacterized protein